MRYVTDIAYPPTFISQLAPEWLDLVAVISGFAPPDRSVGFRWCELGCGRGLTSALLAGLRPSGAFVGIDLMAEHIDAARRFASEANVANVEFHRADFADAAGLGLPKFDYIVAHGVLSWIDAAAQAALERFIDHHLAPGGLVYLSYNNMVDWAADAPFQHLVFALAAGESGASDTRYKAAAAHVMAMADAGAPALRGGRVLQSMMDGGWNAHEAYLAHEFLQPAWRPRYLDDVSQSMSRLGLRPIGSAVLSDNFDTLSLRAKARAALAAIPDPARRDLARDYFLNRGLRRDVYGRGAAPLSAGERSRRLLDIRMALNQPTALIPFEMQTPAGVVRFDNPVSRAIVAALKDGARPASEYKGAGASDADLVSNLLMLCCAQAIVPAGEDADIAANAALDTDELATPQGVLHMMRSGMPHRLPAALLAGHAGGDGADAWLEFIHGHG